MNRKLHKLFSSLKTGLSKNKKIALVFSLAALSFLLAPHALAASVWSTLGEAVGSIIYLFILAIGQILILVIRVLILVASYQHFIDSGAVIEGWALVRDISNMFFVVVLLVIAFGTILHLENYNYKKWLPKLILMAILINFSKTICGLFIDVAQLIMLTFVNAFRALAGGNLIDMLGIKDVVTLATNSGKSIGFWQIIGAYTLGLIYVVIALVVITTMLAVLAMRLVMIWIYVVLSPLAYLLSAFPGGSKYASQWWQGFIKNLVVGPVLAFFIWLSFAALQTGNHNDIAKFDTTGAATQITNEQKANLNNTSGVSDNSTTELNQAFITSEASTPGVLIKFIIAIGMLLGGLRIANEIGGEAGSMAGKGMQRISKMGAGVSAFGSKWGKKVLTGDNMLARKTMKGLGVDFRPISIASAVKSSYEKVKQDDEAAIKVKGIENMRRGGARAVFGGVGAGQDWANNYVEGFLGIKGAIRAGKETFFRPGQRKNVREELDNKKKELDSIQQEKESYISTEEYNRQSESLSESKSQLSDFNSEINEIKDRIRSGNSKVGDSDRLNEITDNRDKLKLEIDTKQQELDSRIKDDTKYEEFSNKEKAIQNQINDLKEKMAHIAPPKALEARGEYRAIINDRKKKYDFTNADEGIQFFEDSVRRKDKFDQMALLEKLSNDANLNEVLNARGYGADAKGLYKFIHNMENDRGQRNGLDIKGQSEQELLRLQNDLSEAEERVNHWEMAKTVGMNDYGQLESLVKPILDDNGNVKRDSDGKEMWDDHKHVIAAASEVSKMDPQKSVILLNRLAVGGEDGNGNFQISNLGKVLIRMFDRGNAFITQASRIQQNLAINLTNDNILPILKQLGVTLQSMAALEKRGRDSKSGSLNVPDVLDNLERSGAVPKYRNN